MLNIIPTYTHWHKVIGISKAESWTYSSPYFTASASILQRHNHASTNRKLFKFTVNNIDQYVSLLRLWWFTETLWSESHILSLPSWSASDHLLMSCFSRILGVPGNTCVHIGSTSLYMLWLFDNSRSTSSQCIVMWHIVTIFKTYWHISSIFETL